MKNQEFPANGAIESEISPPKFIEVNEIPEGVKKTLEKRIRQWKIQKAWKESNRIGIEQHCWNKPIAIDKISLQNLNNIQERLAERATNPLCTLVDKLWGKGLPNGFNTDIAEHADVIFQETYLQPFRVERPLGTNKLRGNKIERTTHGAMHASRVGAWVKVWAGIYRKYGDKEAQALNEQDLLLIQIAALFHDAARKDEGIDYWDNASGEECYRYLKRQGLDEERSRFFSNAARHKDAQAVFHKGSERDPDALPIKTIAHKLIHDADCLDILRVTRVFNLQELDFYKYIAQYNPEALKELVQLVSEARDLIKYQADLAEAASINLNGKEIATDVGITFDEKVKKRYEHAQNCFVTITDDIANYPLLSQYYKAEYKPSVPVSGLPRQKTALSIPPGSYLTPEEAVLYRQFLEMDDLILHHTTSYRTLQNIFSSLRPAALQDRQEIYRQNNRSGKVDSLGDVFYSNVFFGLAVGLWYFTPPIFLQKPRDPNMLSDVKFTVVVNIKKLLTLDPHEFEGSWVGDHIYNYYGHKTESVTLGETQVARHYSSNWKDNQYFLDVLYQDANGTRIQRMTFEDQLATGKDIWPMIGLMLIERLWLLGEDNSIRQYLLRNPHDTKMISFIMQQLFNVEDFELKIPSRLTLDPRWTRIICFPRGGSEKLVGDAIKSLQTILPNIEVINCHEEIKKMALAAQATDQEEAIEALKKFSENGNDLSWVSDSLEGAPSALAAAAAAGNTKVVTWLIEQGCGQQYFKQQKHPYLTDMPRQHTKERLFVYLGAAQGALKGNRVVLDMLEKEDFRYGLAQLWADIIIYCPQSHGQDKKLMQFLYDQQTVLYTTQEDNEQKKIYDMVAKHGTSAMADTLVSKGVDVKNLFEAALQHQNIEVLRYCLEQHKIDVNTGMGNNNTPLALYAFQNNKWRALDLFIQHGAKTENLSYLTSIEMYSYIFREILLGSCNVVHIEALTRLIKNIGIASMTPEEIYASLIYKTVFYMYTPEQEESVGILLKAAGLDINMKTNQIVLNKLIQYNHWKQVEKLAWCGVRLEDENISPDGWRNILCWAACRTARNITIPENQIYDSFLVQARQHINTSSEKEMCALARALESKEWGAAKILLTWGARWEDITNWTDIIFKIGDSSLALSEAEKNGLFKIKDYINVPNEEGHTALTLALKEHHSYFNFINQAMNLIQWGATIPSSLDDISMNDISKFLLIILRRNYWQEAEQLITAGVTLNGIPSNQWADIIYEMAKDIKQGNYVGRLAKRMQNYSHIQNDKHETALDKAILNNDLEVVKILIKEFASYKPSNELPSNTSQAIKDYIRETEAEAEAEAIAEAKAKAVAVAEARLLFRSMAKKITEAMLLKKNAHINPLVHNRKIKPVENTIFSYLMIHYLEGFHELKQEETQKEEKILRIIDEVSSLFSDNIYTLEPSKSKIPGNSWQSLKPTSELEQVESELSHSIHTGATLF